MIIGIIIGIVVTLFITMIIGMYVNIMKVLGGLQNGLIYLIKREQELEQAEEQIDELTKVNLN